MARTVLQLKTWSAENLHERVTNTVWVTGLFPRWVTQIHNRIMSFKVWHWNEDVIQLSWPAAGANEESSTLYLPEYIDKILSLYPGTTVGTGKVVIVSATEMDRWRPAVGTVLRDYLVLFGYYGVENHLAADGVVTINSSVGTLNQTVLVEGLDANDREQREEITVAAGGTQAGTSTFKAGVGGVHRITLIGDSTGTPVTTTGIITATGDGGGTTLFRCDSSREVAKEHQRTELYAVASATATFTCRFYRKHFPFTRDQDIVRIPEQFDDLMELGLGEKVAFFRQEADEVRYYKEAFSTRLREMVAWDNRQPGKKWQVRPRRRYGRLGRLSR
jgi:hypothetical protein